MLGGVAGVAHLAGRGAPPATKGETVGSEAQGRKSPAHAETDLDGRTETAPVAKPTGESPPAPAPGKSAREADVDETPVGAIGSSHSVGATDETAAIKHLATHGDAAAEYELGSRLAEGRGVARDAKAAAVWFEKAAMQGVGAGAISAGIAL